MATLTIPNILIDGATITADSHNENYQAIKVFADALSAGTNFVAGAIGTATLTNSSVTTAKIASSVTLTTPIIGVAAATSIASSGNVVYHTTINPQIASYTLLLTDDGTIIEINSATPVNLTVPLNATIAFPTGTSITIIQMGLGQITVVPVSGSVTVNATPGLKIRAQYAAATLIKRATNTWILVGDLAV